MLNSQRFSLGVYLFPSYFLSPGKTTKHSKSTYKMSPRWTYRHCGIQEKLLCYINIAENKLKDDKCVDRDVHLSLTMYSELYKLLNKSEDFQPYIFGRGCY